ncbi:MAG: carotenoid oxygenase family protein [Ilumatobacter sp.]|uniref:carotenoid oxygenase family protein n=1 Tax=Ilumatobacter sp. TaxID=1967498 RepID=UPI00391DF6C1
MTTTDEPITEITEAELPWHLRENRAPIPDEVTITDLQVVGALPPELNGRYLRNGANPVTGHSEHWFLGDGMIHGIELSNGSANWYRNRYVRTPLFENPGVDRMELGYLNPETISFDYEISTANTHVIAHNGKILALEEGAFPYEITPQLDTVGPCTFNGKLATAMTAHPKICPETGELLFFGYSSLPPYLVYHRVSATGEVLQSTEISVTGPTMMHDFVVSRNYSVFMDLPAIFDMELAMSGGMPIRWSDEYPARFGIMPRTGSDADVRWFDVDPCYVFHTLNAHEEGDEVVVRGCRIRELWRTSADIGDPDQTNADDAPRMWEWRFNLSTGAVSERQLDDRSSEFPRVPDALVGLPNRYGYSMSTNAAQTAGEIFKYDLANGGSRTSHVFPEGQMPGEPVFVPADGATSEDDGYLLTFVHDETTDTSHLTVLDASSIESDPVAQVHLPRRIPAGFHGSWVAD